MALSDDESDDVFLLLRRLIAATMTTFGCPNYHISQYVGEITEEPLPHLHWRLEPRFDAPPSVWVPFSELPSLPLEERERIAENLRAALGADQAAI